MNDENAPVVNTTGNHLIPGNVTVTVAPWQWNTSDTNNAAMQYEWPPGGARLPLAVEVPEIEDDIDMDDDMEVQWEGILGFEGFPTDDRRYLIPGDITERDLPMSLQWQIVSDEGHKNSVTAGKIEKIWRLAMPTIGPRAVAIMGSGVFDTGDNGREAGRLVEEEMLRGVSFDLAPSEYVPIDANTLEPIPLDTPDLEQRVMSGDVLTGMKAKIMGATLVPFPAFADAHVRVISADRVLVASAHAITITRGKALTASAAGMAPLEPPAEWFRMPEANQLTPLTVTDDGQVYGHLAPNNLCHTGVPNACRLSPRSKADYRYFHVGEIRCADGQRIPVGRIVVDDTGGHAPLGVKMQQAQKHYDKPAKVGAFVRASEGRFGIWLSGAVRADAPASLIRDLMANPPSGDWREINGNLELIAACSVPVPGFPVPRAEYAMVASAGGEEQVTALIIENSVREPVAKADLRKIGVLARQARQILGR